MFDAELLVLDADGVVFSAEIDRFVRDRAEDRGGTPDRTLQRWHDDVSARFWFGGLTPSQMWEELFPGENPAQLTADLERRYRPGPLFDLVARGDRRIWLLANDRSGWLLPRLRRFGIDGCVEQVLVSDQIGAATPSVTAFAPLLEAARFERVLLVDDEPAVVTAAVRAGLDACLPTAERASVTARRVAA